MTREETIKWLESLKAEIGKSEHRTLWHYAEAIDMAIEALSADTISREEAIQAIDKCRERKNKEIEQLREQLREFYSQQPTIPMFKESEEAYKAWTGEEMGKTGDEINEMDKEIIKDILKTMPTAYLLEALGVSTFEELTEQADRPHGEWINRENCQVDEDAYEVATCSNCKSEITIEYPHDNFCPNCGAKMGGDGE